MGKYLFLLYMIINFILTSCTIPSSNRRFGEEFCRECEKKNILLIGKNKSYLDEKTNFQTKKAKINKYHGSDEWTFVGFFRNDKGSTYYEYYTGIVMEDTRTNEIGGYQRIDIYFSESSGDIYYVYCSYHITPTNDLE